MKFGNSREAQKIFLNIVHFGNFSFWVAAPMSVVILSMCATDSISFLFYVTEHILNILQHLGRREAPNDSGARPNG